MTNLVDELLELSDPETDKKIITTFEMKDRLCPEIFDGGESNYVMKKEVLDRLLEITDDFIDFAGVDFFIHDVILMGSLANYNWSEYSDVDLHILVDMDELNEGDNLKSTALNDIVKEFFDAKKSFWNEKYTSSGVYSVLNNEWISKPSNKKETIDTNKILEKGEYFTKKIDDLIVQYNNDTDVSDGIKNIKDKLKKFRKSGLIRGGEYSYENLTFKLLRRNGYIEKLMNLRKDLSDKKLSLS
jgi:predicted nucleotidyltransferase